jgi:hypothetical protein
MPSSAAELLTWLPLQGCRTRAMHCRRKRHQSNKRVRKLRFVRPPTHLLQSTLTVYFDTDTLTDFSQKESKFFLHANVNICQMTRCRARQGTAGSSLMRNVFKQKHSFDHPYCALEDSINRFIIIEYNFLKHL